MYTQTTINVQGENQDAYEVYADETKEQTIGFVFDETTASLLTASKDLLVAMKAMFKECSMIHKYGGDIYNGIQATAAIKAGREAIAKAEAVV